MGLSRDNLHGIARDHYDEQIALQKAAAAKVFVPVPRRPASEVLSTPPASQVDKKPSKIAERVRKGIRSSKFDAVEFLNICDKAGIPRPQCEFKFHPIRKWKLDFCWPNQKLALEVEGAVFIAGGHTRGTAFMQDMEKYNSLAICGFRLLRCTPSQLLKFETVEMVIRAMKGRPQ